MTRDRAGFQNAGGGLELDSAVDFEPLPDGCSFHPSTVGVLDSQSVELGRGPVEADSALDIGAGMLAMFPTGCLLKASVIGAPNEGGNLFNRTGAGSLSGCSLGKLTRDGPDGSVLGIGEGFDLGADSLTTPLSGCILGVTVNNEGRDICDVVLVGRK